MNEDAKNYMSNELIPTIKGIAKSKIIAFLPETAQSNLNARMNELNLARFDRVFTSEETLEIELMHSMWNRARAIRDVSNVHEAALNQLTTLDEVKAYNYMVSWPE